jgi:hypothetical protein
VALLFSPAFNPSNTDQQAFPKRQMVDDLCFSPNRFRLSHSINSCTPHILNVCREDDLAYPADCLA